MGTRTKPKIKINKAEVEKAMVSRGIQSYLMLAFSLAPDVEDISESSIWRWNRDGWPERKFAALCGVLSEKPYKSGESHSLGAPV